MPDWTPNWDDVEWDHGAAKDAVRALRQAANRLEEAAAQRENQSREAKAEWRGGYRQEFDNRLVQQLRQARQIANAYKEKANEILRADQLAYEEQKRREAERERWYREKKAEEQANKF